jgi:hypothetical protein
MARLPAADCSIDFVPDLEDDLDGLSTKGSISVPDFSARFDNLVAVDIYPTQLLESRVILETRELLLSSLS